MLKVCLGLFILTAAWGQTEVALMPVERTAGPIAVGDRSYMVVLRVVPPPVPGEEETVASVQVREADGALAWEKTMPYRVDGKRFEESWTVNVVQLQGKKGQGLLLTFSVLPSTPLGGESWQVLGVVEGKLAAFSKPVALEGSLVEQVSDKPVSASWDNELESDILNFRVWTGRFFAVVPLAVNWEWGRFRPAYPLPKCRWNIETNRQPTSRSTLKLYASADEKTEPAEISIGPASTVELLSAEGGLIWEDSEDQIWLSIHEDLWLQVRIDGKQGWIHDPEDFDALGLPSAG